MRATPDGKQTVNRSAVYDATSKLAQLALRDEVLHLSRRDAETRSGLRHGRQLHDR